MKKILIIEDEEDIRDVLEMIIEVEFDVEIIKACNGLEGVEKIDAIDDLSLILCDMNMPKLRGDKVFAHNKETKNCPFLLLSAEGDTDIQGLTRAGLSMVKVTKNPMVVQPEIKSLGNLPGIVNEGWIEKLESKGLSAFAV